MKRQPVFFVTFLLVTMFCTQPPMAEAQDAVPQLATGHLNK